RRGSPSRLALSTSGSSGHSQPTRHAWPITIGVDDGKRAPLHAPVRNSALSGSAPGVGVREEELLPLDLVICNGLLPLLGEDPVDELLAVLLLHVRVLLRVDENDAVLVEQSLVALDCDLQLLLVLERDPGAAVGQHIGA